jgi:hypothetical protein
MAAASLVADDTAMLLLDEIAGERCGPGDPASFDPKEFVMEQLEEWIKRTGRTIDE